MYKLFNIYEIGTRPIRLRHCVPALRVTEKKRLVTVLALKVSLQLLGMTIGVVAQGDRKAVGELGKLPQI